jgi:hypothetical protein
MKRLLLALISAYLFAAVVTRAAEAVGIGPRRCGCEPDCWCKNPGLTLFRWVTPKRKHHLLTPADKQMLAEAQGSN